MKILGLKYKTITSPVTGRVWLDRNIGASRVAEGSTDKLSYGHYLTHKEAQAIDKLVKGFRLPTPEEFRAEELENGIDAFNKLGMPLSGYRNRTDGAVSDEGSDGHYWSGSVSGTHARRLGLYSSAAYPNSTSNRAYRFNVRLIKDES